MAQFDRQIAGITSHDDQAHDRKKGTAPHDETSYHTGQANWGVAFEHWPEILYKFEPDQSRPDATPQTWYHEQHLVINAEKKPMGLFPELPLNLSSMYEGAFIVAVLRHNADMEYEDLRSRMPATRENGAGKTVVIRLRTLVERSTGFRNCNGLLTWKKKGDPKREAYLSSLLTQFQKENNTIRGRAFTAVEMARLLLLGRGSQPSRSRNFTGNKTNDEGTARSQAVTEKLIKQAQLDEDLHTFQKRWSNVVMQGSSEDGDHSADESTEVESADKIVADDETGKEECERKEAIGMFFQDVTSSYKAATEDIEHLPSTELFSLASVDVMDQHYIRRGIEFTFDHFCELTGYEGMQGFPKWCLSFKNSYGYLQGELRRFWLAHQRPDPCPLLRYRMPNKATGTFTKWQYGEKVFPTN
ncbi:MAG: hypothetical protein Q9226_005149 [Calogaya cf. arnoldii]